MPFTSPQPTRVNDAFVSASALQVSDSGTWTLSNGAFYGVDSVWQRAVGGPALRVYAQRLDLTGGAVISNPRGSIRASEISWGATVVELLDHPAHVDRHRREAPRERMLGGSRAWSPARSTSAGRPSRRSGS